MASSLLNTGSDPFSNPSALSESQRIQTRPSLSELTRTILSPRRSGASLLSLRQSVLSDLIEPNQSPPSRLATGSLGGIDQSVITSQLTTGSLARSADTKAVQFTDQTTAGIAADDLLGGGLPTKSTSQSLSSVTSYPGYLLQYTAGRALEQRPAVLQWQTQMKKRGWSIQTDGLFGPESERIARQFQQEKGLTVDGIVGPRTWAIAFDNSTITPIINPPQPPVAPVPAPTDDASPDDSLAYPGRLLSYTGDIADISDPAVRQFQARLKALGWPIQTDGFFGPQSEAATRGAQRQLGLTADGIVGPQTWAAIFDPTAPNAPDNPNLSAGGTGMRINRAGLDLIKSFEGLRLNSYRDAVGVWTIGYGHTRTAGPGQRISLSQATDLLRDDIARFEKAVNQAVNIPINSNQFSALVSFAYNVGVGALNSSTLLRRLNAGDTFGAANELLRWNRAGGRVLAGLTRRRVAERELFLS